MSNVVVAVIDMGSNSFRLQISEVTSGIYRVIEDYKETLRIGDIVYRDEMFTPEAIDRIINTLMRMNVIIQNNKIDKLRIVGTSPFRDMPNTNVLSAMIKERLGFEIDIISGDEEARLTYLAATHYFNLSDMNALLVDLGGGSAEFSINTMGQLTNTTSLPLGCSRLTQKFMAGGSVESYEIKHIEKYIVNQLASLGNMRVDKLIFTGGTVNSIAQIHSRRSGFSDTVVKYADEIFIYHLINELTGKSCEERAKIPGMESERADISLVAALTVRAIMDKYNVSGFYTFSGGLREGLTIDLLNKMGIELFFQNHDTIDIRYSQLMETGRKYKYEETHALHVVHLSKLLFNGLQHELKLKESNWTLLEGAAILHDIGQYISHSEHQKHSYYLIKNAELTEYDEREKEVIANVARYHRRSMPKQRHENFSSLKSSDRKNVLRLAAILRVADGLDRSHTSAISDIDVEITEQEIKIIAISDRNISTEIVGAEKKKDLLEEITEKKIVVAQL